MRRYILALSMLLSLSAAFAGTDNWRISKSTHFLVYYKSAPEDFIKELMEEAEGYYDKIVSDLGFSRYNFWSWDNRAKFYVYDNLEDYRTATGQPIWSGGAAVVTDKTIYTYLYNKSFFETTLPHEMGHIIFREFVGFDNGAIPLWLEEGVASYQEKLRYSMADRVVREAVEKENFMPLEKLSSLNLLTADQDTVQLFYLESFSLIEFLLRKFGREAFMHFCRSLRDKKNLEEAIRLNYPFNNLQGLEQAWKKYLLR
ncbi:MAG: peptidase MA family metallohydrolase [Candidatus Omnitrophota bacterium]|nr:peptidase MA family metallohydrolase [Candidatus Omnitrophota bacterium]